MIRPPLTEKQKAARSARFREEILWDAAMQVLQVELSNMMLNQSPEEIAKRAYDVAEAMLAERNKR